jgi:hypothetical protein
VGMPGYYGLAKILFGVDNLKVPEDKMALGFTRLILEGLHAPSEALHMKGSSKARAKKRRTQVL